MYFDLAPSRHAASNPDWRGDCPSVRRDDFCVVVVVVVAVVALGGVLVVVLVVVFAALLDGFGAAVLVEAVLDVDPQFQKLLDVDLGLAVVGLAAAVLAVVAGLALEVVVLVVVLGFAATVAVAVAVEEALGFAGGTIAA